MPIEEKVKAIIVEQLGVKSEEVIPGASFIEDLGADSLDTVELIMALEEEFEIDIPDEDAEKIKTVGEIIKYVENKANQRGKKGITTHSGVNPHRILIKSSISNPLA